MQYGDPNLGAEFLYSYMGSNPVNDNVSFVDGNSLPSFSRAVNQRDADLVYFWNKVGCVCSFIWLYNSCIVKDKMPDAISNLYSLHSLSL